MRRMMPACAAPLEWDEDLRTFKKTPLHNWASHSADAFRYLSMAWREPMEVEEQPDPVAELLKKRTWQDVWEIYTDEQTEDGVEMPEGFNDFNLNNSRSSTSSAQAHPPVMSVLRK
jgi:hypothetical protein